MDQSNSSLIEETINKLNELDGIVSKLGPAIQPEAVKRLAPMYFDDGQPLPNGNNGNKAGAEANPAPTEDREQFFSSLEDKPAENVRHIAAWFYSQYGVVPITNEMISKEAIDLGRIVPDRPDNTMRFAKDKKKKGQSLFRKNGKGWQWTVSGELYVKETYKIGKGKNSLPEKEPK